jgi:adenylyltransferase/sulfurtransferase
MSKGVALVSGAAIRMEGQLASYLPHYEESPCYQCLYQLEQDHAPTCSEEGVVSPLVGIVGSMQAMHAMLILLDETKSLVGKLHLFDAYHMEWRSAKVSRDPECPACKSRLLIS